MRSRLESGPEGPAERADSVDEEGEVAAGTMGWRRRRAQIIIGVAGAAAPIRFTLEASERQRAFLLQTGPDAARPPRVKVETYGEEFSVP